MIGSINYNNIIEQAGDERCQALAQLCFPDDAVKVNRLDLFTEELFSCLEGSMTLAVSCE